MFTDAEAGAKEFPSSTSRSYNYFTPAQAARDRLRGRHGRRPARPRAPSDAGLGLRFADGTSGFPQEWTALKSGNWHVFLDPNEEWEQTIYRNNANVVRQIQQNIENAKAARFFQAGTAPGSGSSSAT